MPSVNELLTEIIRGGGELVVRRAPNHYGVICEVKNLEFSVYGESRFYSQALRLALRMYLLKSNTPDNLEFVSPTYTDVDAHVGNDREVTFFFDRWAEKFVVFVKGLTTQEVPNNISERARRGETVYWSRRGFAYKSELASGSSYRVTLHKVDCGEVTNRHHLHFSFIKIAEDSDLNIAVRKITSTPEFEVVDHVPSEN